jgi:hypothetical protein
MPERPPTPPGPPDDGPVEPWALADEITRQPFSAWRMAIVAWVDIARGVAATAPAWLAVWCTAALAAVCYLSAHDITAWPPYAAVICVLLIATWAGPEPPPERAARQRRMRRWRLWARRQQPTAG